MVDNNTSNTWLTPKDVSLDALLAHLPPGKAWAGFRIAGKIANRFMTGLARVHQTTWQFLNTVARQIDYRTSTQLLTEWETAVGIPDICIPPATTIDERRFWIAFRLRKTRWNTIQDWRDLADLFQVNVRITPGWLVQDPALYVVHYPRPYHEFPKLGRFRIYIDILDMPRGGYPYDGREVADHMYPIPYGVTKSAEAFRCIIDSVAPANVLIVWNAYPAVSPNGTGTTFSDVFDREFS